VKGTLTHGFATQFSYNVTLLEALKKKIEKYKNKKKGWTLIKSLKQRELTICTFIKQK